MNNFTTIEVQEHQPPPHRNPGDTAGTAEGPGQREAYRASGNPFHQPSFSLANRLGRLVWSVAYLTLMRFSPRTFHRWRAGVLRLFGARLGQNCRIYPKVRIWAPWNLVCGDNCLVGDDATLYNPARITLGNYATVSQTAYLCSASHDYEDPNFPLVAREIVVHDHAWVCARSSVLLGVTVGQGAVLGLGSVATRSLEPWSVYAGNPAKRIKARKMRGAAQAAPTPLTQRMPAGEILTMQPAGSAQRG